MTHVFHRAPHADLPLADRGDGIWIVDRDGKRYIDASGGAAVSCLGHSNARVIAAIQAQAERLSFAHTGFFTNAPMEALADELVAHAPGALDKVYFVSSGSEAVEAALKLARQFHVERGAPSRRFFISRRQSYHGNTLGALAVGGNFWRRAPFEAILAPGVRHISPCYAYRFQAEGESDEAYGRRAADELENAILDLGAENVAAFICEPVVGATLGAVPPAPGYFRRVREICDRHGLLLIFDEVMCGMGRTGTLHACTQDGTAPDILCIAKGLGAGYQAIGATLCTRQIFDAIVGGSGYFQHGQTYVGHAVACAAALEVQRVIREDNLLDNVRRQGAVLETALTERFGNHRHVGDIRGRGLFQAIELVKNRTTKEPFDGSLKLAARIKQQAMTRGLICYPMGGVVDGKSGDHAMLAPPFIVAEKDIRDIVDRLGGAVEAALLDIGA